MDPVVSWILRAGLAVLFATAAFHKLAAPRAFVATVADYRLLPRAFVTPAAFGIVALEACIALGLLAPQVAGSAALAGAVLLGVYLGAIATNLVRGRRFIDCGCLGPNAPRQPLHYGLVARNAVLIAASVLAALPSAGRPLSWVDGVTALGGVAVVILLFQAMSLLVGQAVGSRSIRRSA